METDKKPKNPPAFPLPDLRQGNGIVESSHLDFYESGQEGMTLKDYFAAKAMQSMITKNKTNEGYEDDTKYVIVSEAYDFAEFMLKERERRNQ